MLINLSSFDFEKVPEKLKKELLETYGPLISVKPPSLKEKFSKTDANRLSRTYLKKIQKLIDSQNHKKNAVIVGSNLVFDYYIIGKLKGKKIKTMTFISLKNENQTIGILDKYEFN